MGEAAAHVAELHDGAELGEITCLEEDLLATKKGIKAVDTTHAIFNLDCAWTDTDSSGSSLHMAAFGNPLNSHNSFRGGL